MNFPDYARFLYKAVDRAERDEIVRLAKKYGAECKATPLPRSLSYSNVVVTMRRHSWKASHDALLPFALELKVWQEKRMERAREKYAQDAKDYATHNQKGEAS